MQFWFATFIVAFAFAADVERTQTGGEKNVTLRWPEPEGLPPGWEAGADVTRAGPFGRVLSVSPVRNIRIYYPESLGQRVKHPIVFFKHGFTAQSSQYRGIIDRMVTHGFVVVADDKGGTNPLGMTNDVEATIKWFLDYTRTGRELFTRDNVDITRVGMTGHSMGGGATTYITGRFGKADTPVSGTDPEFYFRGGAPCQPWTGAGASKSTEAPILVTGGLRDSVVRPTMYRGIYTRSSPLKVMVEFNDSHLAPVGGGASYTPEITNFMYAALLGDKDRWYKYFPANH